MSKIVTVDSIRKELRYAIFCTCFHGFATEDESMKNFARQKAIGFAEFGTRTGLLTPAEGNNWLDGIWDRKPIADVWMEYEEPEEEEKGGD